jgi:hypothetical protein
MIPAKEFDGELWIKASDHHQEVKRMVDAEHVHEVREMVGHQEHAGGREAHEMLAALVRLRGLPDADVVPPGERVRLLLIVLGDLALYLAGANAEGVVCAYPWDPTRKDPDLEAFRAAFRERNAMEPDTYAAHAYDGMNMLIDAIQAAGLNRAKIRDLLAHRSAPYKGATGFIPFSACLDDLGEVFLTRFEGGRWRYYSRQDWDIPRGFIDPRDRVSRKVAGE